MGHSFKALIERQKSVGHPVGRARDRIEKPCPTAESPVGQERPHPEAEGFSLFDDDVTAERAAIIAVEAGIPPPWSDAFAQLLETSAPDGVYPGEWEDLHNAAGLLLDKWGAQLSALGWSPAETMGVRVGQPGWQPNCLLSALARGVRVAIASRNVVTLVYPDGSTRAMMRNTKGWLYE
jgi:hypothetical protein